MLPVTIAALAAKDAMFHFDYASARVFGSRPQKHTEASLKALSAPVDRLVE